MKVFFYIPDYATYDDAAIYLAEGFQDLSIPIYSNRDFWLTSTNGDILLKKDVNVSHHDCDIVILTYTWFDYLEAQTLKRKSQKFPKDLFISNRKYATVYVDLTDGYKTSSWNEKFRSFDLILRAKLNKRVNNPTNLKPWVLGFTNRILTTVERFNQKQKQDVVMQNFGFSHNFTHSCRERALNKFVPLIEKEISVIHKKSLGDYKNFNDYDQLMWNQTDGKHDPEYYEILASSSAVLCFCGELTPGLPKDPMSYLVGGKKALIRKYFWNFISQTAHMQERIIQWDSWRFWEALVAGSIPIHVNLESYGVDLPEMPVDGIHYIGIDFRNIKRSSDRFFELWAKREEMWGNGKKWAIEKYHPKASALRLLEYLNISV